MRGSTGRLGRGGVVAVAVVVGLGAVACGSDSPASTSGPGTTESPSQTTTPNAPTKAVSESSEQELETWQTDLNAVGCYVGNVDGSLGPRTEAAIEAFQSAQGLTVDGKLGPQTEAALQRATTAGTVVCKEAPDSSGTARAVVKVSGADYDKSFSVTSCTNSGETDLELKGSADGITLTVSVQDMKGTLSIFGGDEQDSVDLAGTVTSLSVGDAGDIEASGTFTGSDLEGESFDLAGTCT